MVVTTRRVRRRRDANLRRPRGGSGIAPSFPFTVDSLVPNQVNQGAADTPVQINGQDFQSGSSAYVDGAAQATVFVTATKLTFTFPAALALVPGFKTVVVKRTSFTSNARLFAVLFPVPSLATATFSLPNLAVTGTGFFASGTKARIDGTIEAVFTYATPTSGSVLVPDSVINTPGPHTVLIYNDAPGGGSSVARPFTVAFNASVITSLSITTQYAGRASGFLIIAADPASPFYAESVVHVDGVLASPSLLIDALNIRINIAGSLLPAGTRNITVFNPTAGGGGGESNALPFLAFSPTFDALSITEVPQYFDGFDVTGHVDQIDGNFEATFNGVAQPTTILDSQNFIVSITSAAIAVPGVTTVRLRDTISGATTNSRTVTVDPWDPTRVGPTLRLWLDGGSLINNGSGKASAWNDKSGGNRHCLPVTAGQLASIVNSADLNGMLAARFPASPLCNYVYIPWLTDASGNGLITKTAYTIWCVASCFSAGTGLSLLGDYYGYLIMGQTGYSPTPAALTGVDASGTAAYSRVVFKWNPPPPAPFMLRQRKNAAGVFATRVNRNAEDVQTWTGAASFQPLNCYVGSAASTAGGWQGDLGEVTVCDSDVNATHKALIENRLSSIYGLPFSSPAGKPKITALYPTSCTQYDKPFYLVVENSAGGYTANSIVNVYDTPQPTEFLSATQLRIRFPVGQLGTPGGRAISVADANGISAPTGFTIFAYSDVPGVPNLHTTVPNTALQFSDPLLVRVLGVGFTASTVVKVNGVSLATTFINAGEVRATLPATAFDVLPGPILTVSDPSGDSVNSLEVTLTPWSPLSIAGVTGWWATDDVIVVGGKITQWNDKTGNGHPCVQSDTAKQALYSASDAVFNGKPSAQFDGVDDVYATPGGFNPLGTAPTLVFAAVYHYLSVHGAGVPTQPYVNDTLFTGGGGMGIAAHASPLSLVAYANDGSYRSVSNTNLVVQQTQRCQYRMTAGSLTLEIGDAASAPYALGTQSLGGTLSIGYINFGTNNAINGKVATWVTSIAAWPAQDSICWRNFCRVVYGTTA